MLKIGMSSCAFPLNEESFSALAQAGLDAIEISMPAVKHAELDFAQTKQFADRYGILLWSYHLPFAKPDVLDIASLDEEIRTKTVDTWCELIKKGSEIGIHKFVAHPSSEPKSVEPEERKQEIEQAMRSLQTLAEVARQNGSIVAVENLPRSCLGRNSAELLQLLSADPDLKICFDTNHLLIEDPIQFLDQVASKIVTLHVSDYDFVNERHWLPGEGDINWQLLYQKLIQHGYCGVWMYEIGMKAPATILRSRDLCPADYIANAKQIFAGEKPTPIGTRKENLGMWK
jgi:sugar phosphate isomerase/epimerase